MNEELYNLYINLKTIKDDNEFLIKIQNLDSKNIEKLASRYPEIIERVQGLLDSDLPVIKQARKEAINYTVQDVLGFSKVLGSLESCEKELLRMEKCILEVVKEYGVEYLEDDRSDIDERLQMLRNQIKRYKEGK